MQSGLQGRRPPGRSKRRRASLNQKGVVWVTPYDASLIVRLLPAASPVRMGAVNCDPMRDRYRRLRSLEGFVIRHPVTALRPFRTTFSEARCRIAAAS